MSARAIARAQAAVWIASGLWPIVHMRSFEAVAGRKRDKWLVKSMGLLIAAVGISLAAGKRPFVLGVTSATAIALADIVCVAKGRIPKIYLADAAIELGFVASWLFERSAIARGR